LFLLFFFRSRESAPSHRMNALPLPPLRLPPPTRAHLQKRSHHRLTPPPPLFAPPPPPPSRRHRRYNSLSRRSGVPPLPVVRDAEAGRAADPECHLLLRPSSTSSIQGKQQIQGGTRPFSSPGDSWLACVPPLPIVCGVEVGRATDPEPRLLLRSSSAPSIQAAPPPSPSSTSDDLLPPRSLPERRSAGRPSLPGTAKPRAVSIAKNPHFVCTFVLLQDPLVPKVPSSSRNCQDLQLSPTPRPGRCIR
jgi:hypothetical protein